MRRFIHSVLATLLLLGVGCGTEGRIRPVHGMVEVDPPVLDFGRVALGSTAVRELKVRNLGMAPLLVEDIAIEGLGKDIEIVNRGKTQIPGSSSTILAVRYAPQEEGILERSLAIAVSDEDKPRVDVPVTGVGVRPRVSVEPKALDFGRIELGMTSLRRLTLRNEFDMPVDVRLGRRGDVQYSFSPSDRITVPALGEVQVNVTFLPVREGRAEAQTAVIPCDTCEELEVPMVGIGIDKALVVTPEVIDFQYVPVDRTATRDFTITNAGSEPLEITGMQMAEADGPFSVVPARATLAEGEQVAVQISFTPGARGEATGTLLIESSSARAPTSEILVRGIGGGPEIKVTVRDGTECLEFGSVPLGARPFRYITISNIGADPEAPPLEVTGIYPVPGTSPLFGTDTEVPIQVATGGSVDVPIWYEPNEASIGNLDEGIIAVTSNDGSVAEVHVCARGTASEPPPCAGLEVTPAYVDFGSLDERRGAALSVKIRNVGANPCIIRDLRVQPGSDPVFWTNEFDSYTVEPFGWFGWEVYFDPARAMAPLGAYSGTLEFFAINQGGQQYEVPLMAQSANGCLVPEPNFVDFGNDPAGCGVRGDGITFTNACTVPVVVGDIYLGLPTTEGEFEITDAPGTPMTVDPGEAFSVGVQWNSLTRGINSVPLYVAEDTREGPLMVPLKGELTAEGFVTDDFVQHDPEKADVLLVMDNSATMREEAPAVIDGVGALVAGAISRGIDFHIAVTTTGIVPPTDPSLPACPGGANGAEAGRFFPVDNSNPRILTPATPNAAQELAENLEVGFCHQEEDGMQAMRLALSEPLRSGANAGFLRDEASLAVVFISEDDDHSGFPVNDFLAFLEDLKGRGGARVHALVDPGTCSTSSGPGVRYMALADATGGVTASICAGGTAGFFGNVAATSFAPRTQFALSQEPDAGGITVTVNGMPAEAGSWTYLPGPNAVQFSNPPAPGSRIQVSYTAACE